MYILLFSESLQISFNFPPSFAGHTNFIWSHPSGSPNLFPRMFVLFLRKGRDGRKLMQVFHLVPCSLILRSPDPQISGASGMFKLKFQIPTHTHTHRLLTKTTRTTYNFRNVDLTTYKWEWFPKTVSSFWIFLPWGYCMDIVLWSPPNLQGPSPPRAR